MFWRRWSVITDIVILLISVFLFFSMKSYKASTGPVGPDTYPKITIVIIIALCIWDLITEWLNFKKAEVRESEASESPAANNKFVIYISVSLILYLLLFDFLGYVIDTFLFMLVSLTILRVPKWSKRFLISAGFVLISYLIFDRLFHLVFPSGLLKFL